MRTLKESGPSRDRRAGNDPASHPSQAGALAAQGWGFFLRVPPPLQPSTSGTPGAGRREGGPRAPPNPSSGMWSKRGHRGRGREARTWRGAGPRRWLEVAGACFGGSGSPPGSQPPAKPPPTPAGVPATTTGQPHSPYLARLLSLLRGRHLSEA